MSSNPYSYNFSRSRNATPTKITVSYTKPYQPTNPYAKASTPLDFQVKQRDRLPSKSSHNETFNTGLDETFEQSYHEEMSKQQLLIPEFHRAADLQRTPSKESGLQLSSRSSTRAATGLKSPRGDRSERSPEIQELRRQLFLEETPRGSSPRRTTASEKQPTSFARLGEQGFEFGRIEQEQKITQELLKVGRGLLDLSQLLRESLSSLRTAKREDVERMLPSLDSRIACRRERIGDYKRRLSNSFKVSLE